MKTYFWRCPCCGITKQPASDLDDARTKGEAHEAKEHKGKAVASFGWTRVDG